MRWKATAAPTRSCSPPAAALDAIGDFQQGADVIDLRGYAGILTLGDLERSPIGGSTVIDLGLSNGGPAGVDVLTVEDVLGLGATDFIFA